MIEGVFHPFDVLFWNGKDVRNKTRLERLEYLKSLDIDFPVKIISPEKNILDVYNKYFRDSKTDGIIITKNNTGYHNLKTFKYKPYDMQVIDFQLKYRDDSSFDLQVIDRNGQLVTFSGCEESQVDGVFTTFDTVFKDGDIVEFGWKDGSFFPIRIRDDKIKPNYIEVAENIWNEIKNPICEQEFFDSISDVQQTNNNFICEVNKTFRINSRLDDDLVRTGTIGDGSCLIHSIIYCMSKKYREMDIPERLQVVHNIRKIISMSISMDIWKTLGNGQLYIILYQSLMSNCLDHISKITDNKEILDVFENEKEQITNILLDVKSRETKWNENITTFIKKFKEGVMDKCYEDFINKMSNPKVWIDQTCIGYLSDFFNRDIYFIDSKTKMPYKLGGSIDYKNRRSILIYYLNDCHFESIGKLTSDNRVKRQFKNTDVLIEKIKKML